MSTVLDYQAIAVATFTNMLNRAKAFRAGENVDNDEFSYRYGICDNIRRSIPEDYQNDDMSVKMAHVKDNVVRRVESYSGNYHYPVRSGVPSKDVSRIAPDAENAYDSSGDKWSGNYGASRYQQLEQIIDFIKNKWEDVLTEDRTPCERVGIVRHETVLVHKHNKELYVLHYDDDSSTPYFKKYGRHESDDSQECIDLNDLTLLSNTVVGNRSVRSYIRAMIKNDKAQVKLKRQIQALQSQLESLNIVAIGLEVGLKKQHGVKRAE